MESQNSQMLECFLKSTTKNELKELCEMFDIPLNPNETIEQEDTFNRIHQELVRQFEGESLTEDEFKFSFSALVSDETINKTLEAFHASKETHQEPTHEPQQEPSETITPET